MYPASRVNRNRECFRSTALVTHRGKGPHAHKCERSAIASIGSDAQHGDRALRAEEPCTQLSHRSSVYGSHRFTVASSTSRSQLAMPTQPLSLLVALTRKLVVLVVLLALVILAHQLRHLESRPCRLCAPFLVAEGRALLA